MGVESTKFPPEDGTREEYILRKSTKKTMKSTTAPYDPFQNFYPLEEAIDAYMEIWYRDNSESSDSWDR